jgi:hypothetical protein
MGFWEMTMKQILPLSETIVMLGSNLAFEAHTQGLSAPVLPRQQSPTLRHLPACIYLAA